MQAAGFAGRGLGLTGRGKRWCEVKQTVIKPYQGTAQRHIRRHARPDDKGPGSEAIAAGSCFNGNGGSLATVGNSQHTGAA